MNIRLKIWVCFFALHFVLNTEGQIRYLPHQKLHTGSWPSVTAIGDINNDGLNDIVLGTAQYFDPPNDYKLFIYYQNQLNQLDSPLIIPYLHNVSNTSYDISSIAINDVNDDNLNDIIIGFGDSIGIFFQDPVGNLLPKISLYSGTSVDGLKCGDLNNDGLIDIAVSHWNEDSVKVFYQSINGFQSITYRRLAPNGWSDIALGDINNDGLNDIVHMSGQLAGRIYLFVQNTLGRLVLPTNVGLPFNYTVWNNNLSTFEAIAIGDLNNDDINDIVAVKNGNRPDSKILIWLFDPSIGSFKSHVEYDAYDIPSSVKIADLNCDGKNEIIVNHSAFGAVSIYKQNSLGMYDNNYLLINNAASTSSESDAMSIGDINNDGMKDIVLAGRSSLIFLLNNSNSAYLPAIDSFFICDTVLFDNTIEYADTIITQTIDTIENLVEITYNTIEINHAYKVTKKHCAEIISRMGCDLIIFTDTSDIMVFDTLSVNIDSTIIYSTSDTITHTGINNIDALSIYQLYPNPASEEIIIFSQYIENIEYIEVFDLMGKTFKVDYLKNNNQLIIDIHNLPQGIFNLKLTTREVKALIKRFVVQ